MPVVGNRYYFDLLDDGLYRLDTELSAQENPQRLLHVLRFQFLLCALFHRTVIVPEQWLISSATFREIAFEVVRHCPDFVDSRRGYGEQKQRRVEPPIAFSFYDRGKDELPYAKFVRAFIDRIESNRRIQQAASLDLASNAAAGEVRLKLKELFMRQSDTGRLDVFQEDFLDDLIPLLGEQAAIRLTGVSRYLTRLQRRHALPVDQAAYHGQMRASLARVRAIIDDPPYYVQLERHPGGQDRLRLLRELFKAAERDRLQLHQLTDLWALIPTGLSEDSKRHALSLEAIGRAIMHRALKEESASDIGSLAIGLYRHDAAGDPFEGDILRFVCSPAGYVAKRPELSVEGDDFDMSVLGAGTSYDMAHRIPWPEVWRDIWKYAYSEEWEKILTELRNAWTEETVPEDRREAALLSTLDHINSHVGGFAFRYGGASQPYIHLIAKRLGKTGELTALGDKAGTVADRVQKLFKLGDLTMSIGLGAFIDLAKAIASKPGPYRLLLRTERKFESTSRHIRNIWTRTAHAHRQSRRP